MKRSIAAVGLIVLASIGRAQAPASTSMCLAQLKPTEFARVPVLVEAVFSDSVSATLAKATDPLVDAFAANLRKFAGLKDSLLPAGDTLVTWQDLDRQLEVTAFKGGRLAVRAGGPQENDRGSTTRGTDLLLRAWRAISGGNATVAWPAGLMADSVHFAVHAFAPTLALDGSLSPMIARYALTVFTIPVPWRTAAKQIAGKAPEYPPLALTNKVAARVILHFTIDTLGTVDPASITDGWPAVVPRPTGLAGGFADDFFASAKRALIQATFSPSVIGGCKVTESITLPINFSLDK